jgi:hypothetical protein
MHSGALARDTDDVNGIPNETVTGSATTATVAPIRAVFEATADMAQMSDWSSDRVVRKWSDAVSGSANNAKFRGDVAADSGPNTLKSWMMSSAVIGIKPNAAFEFIAAECLTWRCEFTERDGAAATTKSFSYPRRSGFPKLVRRRMLDESKGITTGMQAALDRIETSLRR